MLTRVCKLIKMQVPLITNKGLLFTSGLVKPVDGTAGYQTGCIFQHTDGTTSTALYVNEGSDTSCDFNPVGTTTQSGNQSVGGTLDVTGVSTVAVFHATGAATLSSTVALADDTSAAKTVTSATPATERLIRSELTVTPSASVAVGANGSLAAIRGAVTLTTAKTITDGYLYGVQGKAILDGATINNGSDHVAGVYAQLSASGTTVTSGHVAILVVSGQSLPASANVNAIYVESGGNKINAVLQSNVACNFFLDVNNFEACGIIATPTGAVHSGALRTIKVQIDGGTYYLLASAVVSS